MNIANYQEYFIYQKYLQLSKKLLKLSKRPSVIKNTSQLSKFSFHHRNISGIHIENHMTPFTSQPQKDINDFLQFA